MTLLTITAAVIGWRRRRPYLLVGWLWYVGMLLPVIGLVQFGAQAEADRFTYLPAIGLSIALAWAAAEGASKEIGTFCATTNANRRVAVAHGRCPPPGRSGKRRLSPFPPCLFRPLAVAAVLTILIVSAWRQTWYWHDSQTLWTHALASNWRNAVAHNSLGNALWERGRPEEAIEHYQTALAIEPNYAKAHNNLGVALADRGRLDEAVARFQRSLQLNPANAEAHDNLAGAHYDLGAAAEKRGQSDQAIAHYRLALELNPNYTEALVNLGAVSAGRGRTAEAVKYYRRALVLAGQQHKTALIEDLSARLRRCEAQ